MDTDRFDSMARSLAATPSRRAALRLLAGLSLLRTGGALGWAEAEAHPNGQQVRADKKRKTKKGKEA